MSYLNRNRFLKHIFLSRLTGPALLLISRYVTSIVGPLVSLLVVRYLGPELFGAYASALAVTGLFGVISNFGLEQAALEAVGTGKYALPVVVRTSIRLGLIYSIVAYSVSAVWVVLGGYERVTVELVFYQGMFFVQTPLLTAVTVGLQTRGLYSRIAVWNWAAATGRWAGTLAAMLTDSGIRSLVVWPLVLTWLVVVGMLVWETRRQLPVLRRGSLSERSMPLKDFFRRSWRFGAAGAMHQLYHRSDSLLLSLIRAPIEVGYYGAAFRVVELLNAFPAIVFGQVLYPKYFRWFVHSRALIAQYYHMTSKGMLAVGMVGAAVVSLFARDLVGLVFGSDQSDAAALLAIMAWAVPARFVAASPGALLTTGDQIDRKLRVQTTVAFVNVALNMALIPAYGAVASAVLMVLTDVVLFGWYTLVVRQNQGLPLWDSPQTARSAGLLLLIALGSTFVFTGRAFGLRLAAGFLVLTATVIAMVVTATAGDRAEFRRLLGRRDTLGG